MDVVLVALYRYQNIAIRTLHSVIKNIQGITPHTIFLKDCDTNIFSVPTQKEEELFIRKIKEINPRIVGINVMSAHAPIARRLTKLVKDTTDALVVWGGVHPTISPETCVNEADAICVGEGEGALTDFVTSIRDKKTYHRIANFWIKDGDRLISNPMRPLIQNLDSVPLPAYSESSFYFINNDKIAQNDQVLLDDYIYTLTSRGCPFSCSYCANSILKPLYKDLGTYTRRRSVKNVIQELRDRLTIKGNISSYVIFIDEVFGTEESWLSEFIVEYKKNVGLPFWLQYNPTIVNEEILKKLVSAGLDVLCMGLETGSDHIRNSLFHRPGKTSEIVSFAKKVHKHGVKIRYNLILDNPYETEESLKETIGIMLELSGTSALYNLFSLQFFPGHRLTEKALKDGHIQPTDFNPESLIKKTTKNFVYVPKLLPYTKKQALQNIIWLFTWKGVNADRLKSVMFNDSLFSKTALLYLNLKSVVLGKIIGFGGIAWRNKWTIYLANGVCYILKGDLKTFSFKLKKNMRRIFEKLRAEIV